MGVASLAFRGHSYLHTGSNWWWKVALPYLDRGYLVSMVIVNHHLDGAKIMIRLFMLRKVGGRFLMGDGGASDGYGRSSLIQASIDHVLRGDAFIIVLQKSKA